jgi:branched-chain amino acid transport system substrate-binding protein
VFDVRTVLRRCIGIAAAAIVAGGPATVPAAEPYDVNVLLPLTGSAAFIGHDAEAALHFAETIVNRTGGLSGRAIRFVVQDDQSNPQIALQLANGLIAKNVPIILGPLLVSECSAVMPVLINGPVMYCISPGLRPPEGSYAFSSQAHTADYIIAAIRYLRLRGLTKIAIVASIDASGQDGERGIDAAIALPENKDSVTIVDREHFNITDVSVNAQMTRVKASGAQIAILWTSGTPFGTVLRGAFETGLGLPLLTTSSNFNYAQLASYAGFMPSNLYMTTPAYPAVDLITSVPMKRAVRTYLDTFRIAGIRPVQGHAAVWDPAMIIVDALRHAGTSATATQLRDYIANLHGFVGINGEYDFRKIPQRGVGIDSVYISRWDPAKQVMSGVSRAGGVPVAAR